MRLQSPAHFRSLSLPRTSPPEIDYRVHLLGMFCVGLAADLGRGGGDERFFSFAGDDLEMDMVLAGKEETLADWKIRETLLFFFGELKDIRENIDGGGRLF